MMSRNSLPRYLPLPIDDYLNMYPCNQYVFKLIMYRLLVEDTHI